MSKGGIEASGFQINFERAQALLVDVGPTTFDGNQCEISQIIDELDGAAQFLAHLMTIYSDVDENQLAEAFIGHFYDPKSSSEGETAAGDLSKNLGRMLTTMYGYAPSDITRETFASKDPEVAHEASRATNKGFVLMQYLLAKCRFLKSDDFANFSPQIGRIAEDFGVEPETEGNVRDFLLEKRDDFVEAGLQQKFDKLLRKILWIEGEYGTCCVPSAYIPKGSDPDKVLFLLEEQADFFYEVTQASDRATKKMAADQLDADEAEYGDTIRNLEAAIAEDTRAIDLYTSSIGETSITRLKTVDVNENELLDLLRGQCLQIIPRRVGELLYETGLRIGARRSIDKHFDLERVIEYVEERMRYLESQELEIRDKRPLVKTEYARHPQMPDNSLPLKEKSAALSAVSVKTAARSSELQRISGDLSIKNTATTQIVDRYFATLERMKKSLVELRETKPTKEKIANTVSVISRVEPELSEESADMA
ncbi:hypothetical protein HN709_03090 [Candidatus Peregrinibacteria bacterium]|jgi:hypothetical protein|nr:hypothetical protein [Candidatus Peregrinibacteria bacterium]MBT7736649.1 hypothetical protein [Candidatus Peregrinibacteria bacterium]